MNSESLETCAAPVTSEQMAWGHKASFDPKDYSVFAH